MDENLNYLLLRLETLLARLAKLAKEMVPEVGAKKKT